MALFLSGRSRSRRRPRIADQEDLLSIRASVIYSTREHPLESPQSNRCKIGSDPSGPEQSGDRHRNSSFNFVVCPRIIFACSGPEGSDLSTLPLSVHGWQITRECGSFLRIERSP